MYIYDSISLHSSWNENCFRHTFKGKSKHKFIFSNFSRKSCRLRNNSDKYDTAKNATSNNIARPMPFESLMTKTTHTHSEYLKRIVFYKSGKANTLQYYVKLTVHCLSSCVSSLNDFCTAIALISAEPLSRFVTFS